MGDFRNVERKSHDHRHAGDDIFPFLAHNDNVKANYKALPEAESLYSIRVTSGRPEKEKIATCALAELYDMEGQGKEEGNPRKKRRKRVPLKKAKKIQKEKAQRVNALQKAV